jgi:Polysaccharide pyruvyl transferase
VLRLWRRRTARPDQCGLLVHRTPNLGDDIQALAAAQYWPRVDRYIDRDNMSAGQEAGPVAVILNGWFMHRRDGRCDWPPPRNIVPLFISFHAADPQLVDGHQVLGYYRRHEPIGCRDHRTVELFRARGIDASFSGCLTLTLKNRFPARSDQIVFCDPFGPAPGWRYFCPGEPEFRTDLWARFPSAVRERALFVSHRVDPVASPGDRVAMAQSLLDLYAQASLVVTSRIHCALPCLAFGTPVIFLRPGADPRFGGLLELMNWHPLEALDRGELDISFDAPPRNPVDTSALAASLAARCHAFVQSRIGGAPSPRLAR